MGRMLFPVVERCLRSRPAPLQELPKDRSPGFRRLLKDELVTVLALCRDGTPWPYLNPIGSPSPCAPTQLCISPLCTSD